MGNKGLEAEQTARRYLQQQGLTFVNGNVRYPFGELDLVMRQDDSWVFIEVKYRSTMDYGGAMLALGQSQIRRIRRAASHYMQIHRIDATCRFDLIAIDGKKIQWLQNAF